METEETFLFNEVIFGPVKSRRLGLSLGVNLLPLNSKLCNFNCIYCECGWNGVKGRKAATFNSREEVNDNLFEALLQLTLKDICPDAITFAGNGEPTMHPEFPEIIADTIKMRNRFSPASKIAVLTNASMLNRRKVIDALKKVDLRILKLDAGTDDFFQKINQPVSNRSLKWILEHLHYFNGDLIIQSMFLKGTSGGQYFDNTSEANVTAWLSLLQEIKPKQVMIYSIDRATAGKGLKKIPIEKLKEIAEKVNQIGIETMVS